MNEKKAKVPEKVAEQRRAVAERILADMEQHGMDWPTNGWSRVMSPMNPATGTVYKGGNRLHLAAVAAIRGYDDRRWCTFNQAKKAGWKVRKGAKSAIVEKWKCYRIGAVEDDDGELVGGVVIPRCVGWWNVFNLADIDGAPDAPAEGLRDVAEDDAGRAADAFIASSRCPVVEGASDDAYYSPALDVVRVPGRAQFPCNEGFLRVLLHEMCHSTMVPLERDASGFFGTPKYAFEELVAELGSLYTAADAGFECAPLATGAEGSEWYGSHVGYLQSWMRALRDDPDELFKAAAKASAAADYILERYNARAASAA